MPLGINDKDRIEKDRKGSDWIGSQILFQDGKRIGSDCRSIFDKRIGIGSQIQKKRIVQFSGIWVWYVIDSVVILWWYITAPPPAPTLAHPLQCILQIVGLGTLGVL